MATLTCPRCGALLARTGAQHSCPACRGVFIERSIIAGILDAVRTGLASGSTGSPYRSAPAARRASTTTARYLLCPVCAKHMNRTRLLEKLDLVVDMCLSHGVWFDEGELDSAAQYAQSETRGVGGVGEGANPQGGANGRLVSPDAAAEDGRLALVLDFFFKRQV
jgi:Zn-finger nucleic acid-binding protein